MPTKLNTLECVLARLIAVAAAAVIVGVVSVPISQHFGYAMQTNVQYGAGLVAGILCWFASRRAFDFTNDCLSVPSGSLQPAYLRRPLPAPAPEESGTANAVDLTLDNKSDGSVD